MPKFPSYASLLIACASAARSASTILLAGSLMLVSSASGADALNYFQNYFVTGDAAYGSVGSLRGIGVNGIATGKITISGVPCTNFIGPSAAIVPCTVSGSVPVDVVAAFLYWETEETATAPSAMNGVFDGKPIAGLNLGSPNNPACFSSGGTSGASTASGRVYRADVLGALPIDGTGHRVTNYTHTIQLTDSGKQGNGTLSLTSGATLVLVYRIQVP